MANPRTVWIAAAGSVLLLSTGIASGPSFGQTVAAAPDFSGIWSRPFLGFEEPLSGPGPVRNTERNRSGTSNTDRLVGDYTNPILTPEAADIVRKRGEISKTGLAFPDPDNQCMSQPVPYIFWNFEIELLQRPDKVTILYNHDHDFRDVRMNAQHPAKVVPSYHGDSVGHYEGDTLVVDTIGVKAGSYTMIDRMGTPYTEAMHIVERYRLIPYDETMQAIDRARKEWNAIAAYPPDPDYKGKGLQLEFTVDDKTMFTEPWTALITYRRSAHTEWEERICAENIEHYYGATQYFSDKNAHVPTASKPEF